MTVGGFALIAPWLVAWLRDPGARTPAPSKRARAAAWTLALVAGLVTSVVLAPPGVASIVSCGALLAAFFGLALDGLAAWSGVLVATNALPARERAAVTIGMLRALIWAAIPFALIFARHLGEPIEGWQPY